MTSFFSKEGEVCFFKLDLFPFHVLCDVRNLNRHVRQPKIFNVSQRNHLKKKEENVNLFPNRTVVLEFSPFSCGLQGSGPPIFSL